MKFRITYTGLFVAVVLGAALLTGIVSHQLVAILVLLASVGLFFVNQIYLAFPIMLFYYSTFGTLAGLSVYRWFSLLFLVATFMSYREIKISVKQLLVFALYIIYCFAVIGTLNIRRSIFAVMDMGAILVLINCYLRQRDKLKNFFSVYVLCAFAAYFTGSRLGGLEGAAVIGGELVEITRNMATFEDPNYMGFFYTAGIFAVVGLKLFTPKLRVVLVIALYAILLTSLSITAIVVNILLWLLYLTITKNLNAKALFASILALFLVLGLYDYGLQNPDAPVVGTLSMRIEEKLQQAEAGDIGGATSSRSHLAKRHLQYFWEQPVHKMLIGMNAASALRTDLNGYEEVAHNEYVDWLLNVGIIGTAIMLYYLVSTIYKPLKTYRRNMTDQTALTVVMIKLVFVLYAFTLTLYGDYRFMLFMLI